MQFTKLFNSILDSTIWQEPVQTKIVWITMLAMADIRGEVYASVPGLARRAVVSLEECEAALECLQQPDAYSRTQDYEGRRIQTIDGGWRLLNHGKYRALLSKEERREYNRRKQIEYRSAVSNVKHCQTLSANVSKCVSSVHSTEAEAEADSTSTKVDVTPEQSQKATDSKATSRKHLSEDEFLFRLKDSYPDIDLDSELRKMDAWLLTRPGKTKSRRFVVNWLNRCDPGVKNNGNNGKPSPSSKARAFAGVNA
jgi:hypothetical protein